jgi:hypothetical protein
VKKIFLISRVQNEEASDKFFARRRRNRSSLGKIQWINQTRTKDTFYFSLTPECMRYVQICADRNIMKKTLTEATQLLQRISEGVAMQRYWEEHISGSVEQETCVEVLA